MRFVDNQEITDPRTNIALETYLVENRLCDEPLLLFYINEPSIIIGRNLKYRGRSESGVCRCAWHSCRAANVWRRGGLS